jgi:predicted MFS family arabinose efflux permease
LPAGNAGGLGWAGLTGPFLLTALAGVLAVVASMGVPGRTARPIRSTRVPLRELLRTHAARPAFAVMATGQAVMVAVMTAAPLDMHMHGHGLGLIGTALAMHTLGMFALSPLTGRLLDRVGARPVVLGGLLTLAVACLAVLGSNDHALTRTAALFVPTCHESRSWQGLILLGSGSSIFGGAPHRVRVSVGRRPEGGLARCAASDRERRSARTQNSFPTVNCPKSVCTCPASSARGSPRPARWPSG